MKRHGSPDAIITDGLRSYCAAITELGYTGNQETARWANNRVENGHLPFRGRERAMLRLRQMNTLQKFASVYANVYNHFSRERRFAALAEWQVLASWAAAFKDRRASCGEPFAFD